MIDKRLGPDRGGKLNAGSEDLPMDIGILEVSQVEHVRRVYGVF